MRQQRLERRHPSPREHLAGTEPCVPRGIAYAYVAGKDERRRNRKHVCAVQRRLEASERNDKQNQVKRRWNRALEGLVRCTKPGTVGGSPGTRADSTGVEPALVGFKWQLGYSPGVSSRGQRL